MLVPEVMLRESFPCFARPACLSLRCATENDCASWLASWPLVRLCCWRALACFQETEGENWRSFCLCFLVASLAEEVNDSDSIDPGDSDSNGAEWWLQGQV
jgi:hypothetical protein